MGILSIKLVFKVIRLDETTKELVQIEKRTELTPEILLSKEIRKKKTVSKKD